MIGKRNTANGMRRGRWSCSRAAKARPRPASGPSTAGPRTPPRKKDSGFGRSTTTTTCSPRRSTGGAPAFAFSFTPTSRRGARRRRRSAGGLTACRSTATTAISTGTPGCRSFRLLEPFVPTSKSIRARLVPALGGLARREEPADRRHEPVAAVEPLPARSHARLQKMLAPVRSFPVSIQSRRQAHAFVLYSAGRDGRPRARRGKPRAGKDRVSGRRRAGHIAEYR